MLYWSETRKSNPEKVMVRLREEILEVESKNRGKVVQWMRNNMVGYAPAPCGLVVHSFTHLSFVLLLQEAYHERWVNLSKEEGQLGLSFKVRHHCTFTSSWYQSVCSMS